MLLKSNKIRCYILGICSRFYTLSSPQFAYIFIYLFVSSLYIYGGEFITWCAFGGQRKTFKVSVPSLHHMSSTLNSGQQACKQLPLTPEPTQIPGLTHLISLWIAFFVEYVYKVLFWESDLGQVLFLKLE